MQVLLSVPPCVQACHSRVHTWLHKAVTQARRRAFLAQNCADDLYTLLASQQQQQRHEKEEEEENRCHGEKRAYVNDASCFLASEPPGEPLGSGAGTIHLLQQCFTHEAALLPHKVRQQEETMADFAAWLRRERRIVVHAGGQSRRLPSYATLGKSFVPIPIHCQQLSTSPTHKYSEQCEARAYYGGDVGQTLLAEQLAWLMALLQAAPPHLNTLVACGDVLLRDEHGKNCASRGQPRAMCEGTQAAWQATFAQQLRRGQEDDVDVLCVGLPCEDNSSRLTRHGVLLVPSPHDGRLCEMRQKMSAQALEQLCATSTPRLCPLLDSGVWLLSTRALQALHERCSLSSEVRQGTRHTAHSLPPLRPYNLYGEFGPYALGTAGVEKKYGCASTSGKTALHELRTCALSLPHTTAFYHLGTSTDMLRAMAAMRQTSNAHTSEESECTTRNALRDTTTSVSAQTCKPSHKVHTESAASDSGNGGDGVVIVQNSRVFCRLPVLQHTPCDSPRRMRASAEHIWIENSCVAAGWRLQRGHIITNVPPNDWRLVLVPGVCIDVVPVTHSHTNKDANTNKKEECTAVKNNDAHCYHHQYDVEDDEVCYVARPYGLRDSFTGRIACSTTQYLQQPLHQWLRVRGLTLRDLRPPHTHATSIGDADAARTLDLASDEDIDLHAARLFPCGTTGEQLGLLLAWMIAPDVHTLTRAEQMQARTLWRTLPRYSAAELLVVADVAALTRQREHYRASTLDRLITPHEEANTATIATRGITQLNEGGEHAVVQVPDACLWRLDLGAVAHVLARDVYVPNAPPHASTIITTTTTALPAEGTTCWEDGGEGKTSAGNLLTARRAMLLAELCRLSTIPEAQRNSLSAQNAERGFCHLRELVIRDVLSQQQQEEQEEEQPRQQLQHILSRQEGARENTLGLVLPTHTSGDTATSVCARCPLRMDLCGGWTDTPPYSLLFPGHVINAAITIDGGAPIEVHIDRHDACELVLHVPDRRVRDVLRSYEEIRHYATVESNFSLARACLAVAGFLPDFAERYRRRSPVYGSLQAQLRQDFGNCGFVLTMQVHVPTGSGLGGSSLLAGTILGALNAYCHLGWSREEIARLVLVVEQMVTAGGGWQDAYGGLYGGVKLLTSTPALNEGNNNKGEGKEAEQQQQQNRHHVKSYGCTGVIQHALPDRLFCAEPYKTCHLLYFTGRTRVAKNILGRVVRRVLLNDADTLRVLQQIGQLHHAMAEAIAHTQLERFGRLVHRSMCCNMLLDELTCPAEVRHVLRTVRPYVYGAKTAGAGGGGYIYMVAKSAADAQEIRAQLARQPPHKEAGFVDMAVCHKGLQVTCA